MTGVWVDTDFGFDDLWALLLLRHLNHPVAGISLVAGNAPLPQVVQNALGAMAAYGLDWPVWQGADRPLTRSPETAQNVLGPTGIRSRGRRLPDVTKTDLPTGAVAAFCNWLSHKDGAPHHILALGPLTNIAHLLAQAPELADRIGRLVWMGGSAGRGNHTVHAEFNAVADAEALSVVLEVGLNMDIVDLEFCRCVIFGPDHLPETDPLTRDLLGGYLDIALERGRPGMAIYDPLAAVALAAPELIEFTPCAVSVSIAADDSYGATCFSPQVTSRARLATKQHTDLAQLCLTALTREALDGARL